MAAEPQRVAFKVLDGAALRETSRELPQGKYLVNVNVNTLFDVDTGPIFLFVFVSDAKAGVDSVKFNQTVVRGILTQMLSPGGKDLSTPTLAWQGSIPTSPVFPTHLRILAVNQTGTDVDLEITYIVDDVPGGGGNAYGDLQMVWRGGGTWALRQVYTQTNAGGGTIDVRIGGDEGTEFEIIGIQTGPDDYTGDETVQINIIDEDANTVYRLTFLSTVDNEETVYPLRVGSQDTSKLMNKEALIVSGGDIIQIAVSAIPINETLTINVRLRLRGGLVPAIDRTNSTGTVGAPTTTINRVM